MGGFEAHGQNSSTIPPVSLRIPVLKFKTAHIIDFSDNWLLRLYILTRLPRPFQYGCKQL